MIPNLLAPLSPGALGRGLHCLRAAEVVLAASVCTSEPGPLSVLGSIHTISNVQFAVTGLRSLGIIADMSVI